MYEPWRYECPECGSVNLFPRVKAGGFRCNPCGHVMPEDQRIDRKTGLPIAESFSVGQNAEGKQDLPQAQTTKSEGTVGTQ